MSSCAAPARGDRRVHRPRQRAGAPGRPAGPGRFGGAGGGVSGGRADGAGKITLAVQAGHATVQLGWFSGLVFVDLDGYDDTPVGPAQALDALNNLGSASRKAGRFDITAHQDVAAIFSARLAMSTMSASRWAALKRPESSDAATVAARTQGGFRRHWEPTRGR